MFSSTISGSAGDLLRGRVIEAVAGMDFEPGGARQRRARDDALPFGFRLGGMAVDHGVAPGAGMNFDHRRAQFCRHLDLAGSAAMNSDTRMPASFSRAMKGASALCWPTTSRPPSVVSSSRRSGTRQTACGLVASADPQHVRGRRHLEIQRLGNLGLQPRHVVVADVAAVLAQMRGDAVGAGLDRGQRRAHRIRIAARPARCAGWRRDRH